MPRRGRRKKLIALGRTWAEGGQGGKNELDADLAVLGIQLDARHTEPEKTELWAEHIEAFELFAACSSQWRIVAGMGGAFYQGLDAAALAATMDMLGIEQGHRRERLQQVRQIESGALEVLNKK
ncbi:hypothetical protein GCM10022421_08980 [Oceanisphaera sediminis]|uniref:DUF1799 domain-containing protein n=1 Tax=Oceanisphaera sediminis TaxID=981381 RepID=A0ABP7DDW2_9GAMM